MNIELLVRVIRLIRGVEERHGEIQFANIGGYSWFTEQANLLEELEKLPLFNQFKHACPEWDYLVIKPGDPEWDACGCFVISDTAFKDPSLLDAFDSRAGMLIVAHEEGNIEEYVKHRDALRNMYSEAIKCWHLANGVADLAVKQRDEAERKANLGDWRPIGTAPKDNRRPLLIAHFNARGELISFDYNASWKKESESWEIPLEYYYWESENGNVEEPTHWQYQSDGFARIPPRDRSDD